MAKENFVPAGKLSKESPRSGQSYYDTEVYQAFMAGYVKRINDATLRVPIGGVRIGSAKYSRLAQINLQTHIITFSRFAIENVPERGRRYLVIHELSHVKEASHNRRFWQIVAEHEPRYKDISRELDQAFKKNVRAEKRLDRKDGTIYQTRLFPSSRSFDFDDFSEALAFSPGDRREDNAGKTSPNDDDEVLVSIETRRNPGLLYPLDSGVFEPDPETFDCNDSEFNSWGVLEEGIVHGGSAPADSLDLEYIDHI